MATSLGNFKIMNIKRTFLLAAWRALHRLGFNLRRNENYCWGDLERLLATTKVETIFDCGCNQGAVASHFRRVYPEARIHAFEPLPDVCRAAAERFAEDTETLVHELALCDVDGTANFHQTAASDSSSLLRGNVADVGSNYKKLFAEAAAFVVATRRLDSFVTEHQIDRINILKMDVQGAELSILKGAEALLRDQKIDLIYSEVYFLPFYENQPLFEDIISFLSQFGYRFFYPYNFVFGSKTGRLQWGDAIFVREGLQIDKSSFLS